MFNRYWREYPVFLQLILLMLLVFTMISFTSVLAFAFTGKLYHVSMEEIRHVTSASSTDVINANRFIQLLGNLLTFLVTALLFANFTHPKPFSYVGFHKLVKNSRFVIVLLLAIAFIPVAEQTGAWMRHIDLGKAARAAQDSQDETYKAFLRMNTPSGLLQVLFIMALLPAVGEELFFRGVVMRFAYKGTRNTGLAIFISAAIFAFAHDTLYNFPSIVLAGILLGYIYYMTGSIWFSILFHFINNGAQVLMVYLSQHHILPAQMEDMNNFPVYIIVPAFGIVLLCVWLLSKTKTPLPAGWTNDFDLPEIAADQEQQEI